MRHLLGYLHLEDQTGRCVELINGARTAALIDRARRDPAGSDGCRVHKYWDERPLAGERVWHGNDIWAFNSGQYGADSTLWDDPLGDQDLNPWEDTDNPATVEVAGFLPDAPGPGLGVVLESPTEARVMESSRVEPLELVVTGTVVAGTSRGESAFLQWLNRVLTEPYAFRTGWKATVFTHCPDPAVWEPITDPFDLPPDPNGAPVYTTWDDPAPNLLEDWAGSTPWPLDSAVWELFDVRFVSIDPLTDQPLFPHAVGRRYAIRFAVGRHNAYDRPRTLATLGGSGEWVTGEAYSNPLEVGDPVEAVDQFDLGPPGVAVPLRPGRQSGLIGGPGRWSLPTSCMREAVLTPPRAVTLRDQMIVTIHNPSPTSWVYNARVRFWKAYVGFAPPNTQVGDEFYRDLEPSAELRIIKIGPGETLEYDGRTKRITLKRPGIVEDVVPGRIVGRSGSRVEPPPLECNNRYWVAVELSTDPGSYGDLDLEVTVRGAMEMIPT